MITMPKMEETTFENMCVIAGNVALCLDSGKSEILHNIRII